MSTFDDQYYTVLPIDQAHEVRQTKDNFFKKYKI